MRKISYAGYRFPPEVIDQAIWLYLRFTLSFRDVEDLLAERGIAVSYETVRRWVNHFGPMIAARLRKRRPKPHATWHLDEVYLKIDGRMAYLWRAVDAEGEVWPAAGSVDTEIGCFREPEASDAEAQVQSRVQDRGGPLGG
jgi:putative transposase